MKRPSTRVGAEVPPGTPRRSPQALSPDASPDDCHTFASADLTPGETAELMLALSQDCPEGLSVDGGKSAKPLIRLGADCRTRTCDPLITNQVLYQLS